MKQTETHKPKLLNVCLFVFDKDQPDYRYNVRNNQGKFVSQSSISRNTCLKEFTHGAIMGTIILIAFFMGKLL